MVNVRHFLRVCEQSSDSLVAMEATLLMRRLEEADRERERQQEAHLEAIIAAERAGWSAP
jgi:hypothetical protein